MKRSLLPDKGAPAATADSRSPAALPNSLSNCREDSHSSERGVALLMVVFMITLASALLVALSDSTYVAMRLNSAAARRVRAEYLLKSAINVAKALIKNDITPQDNPLEDAWMQFNEGADVPGEFLGLAEPNVRIQLQIVSEAGKLPLKPLLFSSSDQVDVQWRNRFALLFKNLGFDNDTKEVDQTGLFPGRHFKSDELVANLIDYMDANSESYSDSGFAQGVESQLPRQSPFRNQKIDSLASELGSIPGFTPARVQRLIPLLTVTGASNINLNAAPKDVIRALDPNIDDAMAQRVVDFRNPANGGPFTQAERSQQLASLLGPTIGTEVQRITAVSGTFYEVIAKVDYSTSFFMARSILRSSGAGALPVESSFELY